jgi:pyrimidine and pyridine-specific 5'-nucleotidase
LWLLTNAHVSHATRVVKLLGVDKFFEGLTYCDYAAEKLVAKPHKDMFMKAMREAGVESVNDCYFVGKLRRSLYRTGKLLTTISDDSYMNAKASSELGWSTAHIVDPSDSLPIEQASQYQIRSLQELRDIFPQFFKS